MSLSSARRWDPGCFFIERLAVHPGNRHKGLGSKLLTFAFQEIVRMDGKTASIDVMDANRRLKSWYQGKGFTETACRQFAHLPFTVCFMIRDLAVD